MDPVSDIQRTPPEQQMVPIQNAADWEIDLAPGLLSQMVDLTPYVNSSALRVGLDAGFHVLSGCQCVCQLPA